ncbi:hypothetical protein CIRG_01640 [Coccidioides immitis RMSCC 2394]|uniref:Uncharacterized protein n=1 Tax=Coccidioides immitis RMSCC 2394 TaxID=404692 RepID=A0A0J6XYY8_COCIT|nr:hypothetical protein CIRG_01640 [Coccidioides immitis RMSCC 2394]
MFYIDARSMKNANIHGRLAEREHDNLLKDGQPEVHRDIYSLSKPSLLNSRCSRWLPVYEVPFVWSSKALVLIASRSPKQWIWLSLIFTLLSAEVVGLPGGGNPQPPHLFGAAHVPGVGPDVFPPPPPAAPKDSKGTGSQHGKNSYVNPDLDHPIAPAPSAAPPANPPPAKPPAAHPANSPAAPPAGPPANSPPANPPAAHPANPPPAPPANPPAAHPANSPAAPPAGPPANFPPANPPAAHPANPPAAPPANPPAAHPSKPPAAHPAKPPAAPPAKPPKAPPANPPAAHPANSLTG